MKSYPCIEKKIIYSKLEQYQKDFQQFIRQVFDAYTKQLPLRRETRDPYLSIISALY